MAFFDYCPDCGCREAPSGSLFEFCLCGWDWSPERRADPFKTLHMPEERADALRARLAARPRRPVWLGPGIDAGERASWHLRLLPDQLADLHSATRTARGFDLARYWRWFASGGRDQINDPLKVPRVEFEDVSALPDLVSPSSCTCWVPAPKRGRPSALALSALPARASV